MWRLLYFLFWGISSLSSCSPPSNEGYNSIEDGDSDVTITSIAYIKGLYSGYAYLFTSDIIIEGVITANDAYGEFPDSIVIEDESGAIEIMCDIDCLQYGYAVGATVRVACSGLYLGSVGGMLSIGGAPFDDSPNSELSEDEMLSYVRISDIDLVSPTPKQTTIPALITGDILRFVYISDLEFVLYDDSVRTFCSRDEESGLTQYTTHTLSDSAGNQIPLCVSREVEYADELVPVGSFSIAAIVEYFNGEYRLRIVNCGYI